MVSKNNGCVKGVACDRGDGSENLVVHDRGDGTKTEAIRPLQANQYSKTSNNNPAKRPGVRFTRHKICNRNGSNFGDRISTGDHVGISLDQAKVDRANSCFCCKEEIGRLEKLWDRKKAVRMMIPWEGPKAKFKGISITAHDFGMQKFLKREIPPWHPHQTQSWKHLDVPSVTETTYTRDFGPPSHRVFPSRIRTANMQTAAGIRTQC